MRLCFLLVVHFRMIGGVVLPRSVWVSKASAHRARIAELLGGPPLEVSKSAQRNPLLNFVFQYYRMDYGRKATNLARWSPGLASRLEAGDESEDGALLSKRHVLSGEHRWYDPRAMNEQHVEKLLASRAALVATRARPPVWHCYGMHEWAMLYRPAGGPEPVKHQALATRVDQDAINAAVTRSQLKCTHYDAFRFFADGAKPLNVAELSRRTQIDHEQPACVHANMDLLRYALRLSPFLDSGVVADCLELALDARKLDMRASPYDLVGAVVGADAEPIRVETPEGRKEYVRYQSDVHDRAKPLRDTLIQAYDDFFLARALSSPVSRASPKSRAPAAASR